MVTNGLERLKNIMNEEVTRLKKADYIILLGIVLLYSVIAFYGLGSMKNPQTYFYSTDDYNQVDIELEGDATFITKMRHFTGSEFGDYDIYLSENGEDYTLYGTLKQTGVFKWDDYSFVSEDNTMAKFKYLRMVSKKAGSQLGEIQLYDRYGYKLNMKASNNLSLAVLDELDTVPDQISYQNSTYFDEIYFARTAYEYSKGLMAYEWVHPPLGKIIQMLPITLFGMNPFSYRLMGVLFGIFMIPIMYLLGKDLFKKRKYAFLAASLMALDNFHFAQSRLGTIDTFLVLFVMLAFYFMYRYITYRKETPLKKKLRSLFFSGLFMGCAIATKWTGCFLALALAIIFFTHLIITNFGKGKHWSKETTKIVLSCFLFFVIIPNLLYVGLYFLFPDMRPYYIDGLGSLVKETEAIYKYHSTLKATHPFTSPWYSWMAMVRPVWYYVGYYAAEMKRTIVGIGNPAIWWMGVPALIYLVVQAIRKKKKEELTLLIMILTMLVPYLFIGRVMFMYHFFPVLPFMMLGIVALIKNLTEKFHLRHTMWIYLAVVAVFFFLFYPITSGMMIPAEYANWLKWLPTWSF